MMEGKIPENVLKRSVLKELKVKNENVITGAAFGEDCAILNMKGASFSLNGFAASQDTGIEGDGRTSGKVSPIFGEDCPIGVSASFGSGKDGAVTAVIKAANNLYASGFDFKYAEISLVLGGDFEESDLKDLMRRLNAVCSDLGASIIGGHTQVSKDLKCESPDEALHLGVTAIGIPFDECSGKILRKKDIQPGDSIVVSGQIGIEGAIEIIKKKREEISTNFGESFLEFFDGYDEMLSVKNESKAAIKCGATALKDVSEHGIFGALWELASVAGVGLEADLKAIPVRQEIIEICNLFDINPYEMKSSGMLIMVTKDPKMLINALHEEGIEAALIGTFTDSSDRVVINGEEKRFLEKIKQDALFGLEK